MPAWTNVCPREREEETMRRVATLGVLLLATTIGSALTAVPAAGTEPQVVSFEDQGFFGLPDLNCKGFKLLYTLLDERVTEVTYFDEEGNPTRVLDTFTVSGRFTNSKTGETFRDHAAGRVELDLSTGVVSIAQLGFIYHSAGEGLLFLDAGRRIFDADGNEVFSAGPSDFTDEGGFDGICAALG